MSPLNIKIFLALLISSILARILFHPGWQTVVVFLAVLGFSGFIIWLDPDRKSQISRSEFQELQQMVAQAREDLRATRLKIGLIKQ